MNYSVVSRNTVGLLSLHDCQCARMYYDGEAGKLILEMNWIEVCREHPENPYPQAHQSGPGRIELLEPVFRSGLLYPSFAAEHPEPISGLGAVDFRNLELLSFDEESTQKGFETQIFALFDDVSDYDSVQLEMAYAGSVVMWNELRDVSWFEK